MIYYHGGRMENLEKIIEAGEYKPGFNTNSYSPNNDDGGLYVSNVYEYARQYGPVIEIEVKKTLVRKVQDCPLCPDDFGWQPAFKNAKEYMIPAGVKFVARWI